VTVVNGNIWVAVGGCGDGGWAVGRGRWVGGLEV